MPSSKSRTIDETPLAARHRQCPRLPAAFMMLASFVFFTAGFINNFQVLQHTSVRPQPARISRVTPLRHTTQPQPIASDSEETFFDSWGAPSRRKHIAVVQCETQAMNANATVSFKTLTTAMNMMYSLRHNYAYHIFNGTQLIENATFLGHGRYHPAWCKVRAARLLLQYPLYDYVLVLDTDAFFTHEQFHVPLEAIFKSAGMYPPEQFRGDEPALVNRSANHSFVGTREHVLSALAAQEALLVKNDEDREYWASIRAALEAPGAFDPVRVRVVVPSIKDGVGHTLRPFTYESPFMIATNPMQDRPLHWINTGVWAVRRCRDAVTMLDYWWNVTALSPVHQHRTDWSWEQWVFHEHVLALFAPGIVRYGNGRPWNGIHGVHIRHIWSRFHGYSNATKFFRQIFAQFVTTAALKSGADTRPWQETFERMRDAVEQHHTVNTLIFPWRHYNEIPEHALLYKTGVPSWYRDSKYRELYHNVRPDVEGGVSQAHRKPGEPFDI